MSDRVPSTTPFTTPMPPVRTPLTHDVEYLEFVLSRLIARNPEKWAQAKEKRVLLGWFVGNIMRETGVAGRRDVERLVSEVADRKPARSVADRIEEAVRYARDGGAGFDSEAQRNVAELGARRAISMLTREESFYDPAFATPSTDEEHSFKIDPALPEIIQTRLKGVRPDDQDVVLDDDDWANILDALRKRTAVPGPDTITLTRDQFTSALRESAARGMDHTSGPSSGYAASCRDVADGILKAIDAGRFVPGDYVGYVEDEQRAAR